MNSVNPVVEAVHRENPNSSNSVNRVVEAVHRVNPNLVNSVNPVVKAVQSVNPVSGIQSLVCRAGCLFVHHLTLPTNRLAVDHFIDRARVFLRETQFHGLGQAILE